MTEPRRPDHSSQTPGREGPRIDEELLARAAEINEAVAGEFAAKALSPLDNPLIERLAELGVEDGRGGDRCAPARAPDRLLHAAWTDASRRDRAQRRRTAAVGR
jgi:hypothetical protein